MVDTPEEWEDLVAELSEDWLEDNEYKGSRERERARKGENECEKE